MTYKKALEPSSPSKSKNSLTKVTNRRSQLVTGPKKSDKTIFLTFLFYNLDHKNIIFNQKPCHSVMQVQ